MKKAFDLSPQTIAQNITKLQKFMIEKGLDAFYVSSFDPYLNEYVPLEDCHRYYVTGFTGSVAEVLVPREGKARVYVDGRYHEQVDMEVPANCVQPVKPEGNVGNVGGLLRDIKELKIGKLGLEADRTSLGLLKHLEEVCETQAFYQNELASFIDFAKLPAPKEIQHVERELRGRDTTEKLRVIFPGDKQGMFLAALDGIAWVTNCRGYHLPHLSSFRAKALLTRKMVYVFVTPDTPVSAAATKIEGVQWVKIEGVQLPAELQRLQNQLHLEELTYDPGLLNCADFAMLLSAFGPERIQERKGGLIEWMSIKEPAEIHAMDESFRRADKAIIGTIQSVKEATKTGKRMTEYDLWAETTKQYQKQGAVELSFNTIAGVGPNGSIIHYGSASDQVVIKSDDMVLLDSGGYFASGFATDTTRTFFSAYKGEPKPEYKKIYTLVLKGLLSCQNAVFPEGTRGNVLDGLARAPLMKHGYNYNHGTGHGVGIHVHEDGVRLSLVSNLPMKPGQVVSIEPGIYIPGFGGVRLENIALVEKHPEHKGFLRFRSFVYVGFDHNLIDLSLMNDEEKAQLMAYEKICEERGTSIRALA